jgi:hypothetical protein
LSSRRRIASAPRSHSDRIADHVGDCQVCSGIKAGSSHWLKSQADFPRFESWQDGYGAFTASFREKDSLIEYIKNQVNHHRQETYLDEYRRLLTTNGIVFA